MARARRRGRRPRRRRGLGRRRRDAVVARRAGRRRAAAPSASSPPVAATTSPGCSACPTTRRARPRVLLDGRRTPGRPARRRRPRRGRRMVAGSVYAGVDARAAEIVDRRAPGCRARCSTRTPRCARSPPTGPAATSCRSTAIEREYDAATVVVANSAYYGKGMQIAPPASVEDGLLDVVVIEAAVAAGADALAAEGVRRRARRTCRGHRAVRQAGRGRAAPAARADPGRRRRRAARPAARASAPRPRSSRSSPARWRSSAEGGFETGASVPFNRPCRTRRAKPPRTEGPHQQLGGHGGGDGEARAGR